MAMPTFGASGDSVLLQQPGSDPNKALLAQLLANNANMPAPRTAQAATMQGLASVLGNLGAGIIAGRERADQEDAGEIIAAALKGEAPKEKPGFLARVGNALGFGDDKPAAAMATPSPRARQMASLLGGGADITSMGDGPVSPEVAAAFRREAPGFRKFDGMQVSEGGQPDQVPAVGMPSAPSPDSGVTLPTAAPAGAAPAKPASQKELLAQLLNSNNKYVKAWAMNRALAEADAETKRNAEIDKEFATKGLRRNPDGSVSRITRYGSSIGENEADKFRALTPAEIEREERKKQLGLKYDPLIDAAKTEANNAPLLARREAEKKQDLQYNPQIEGATTDARNRADLRTAEQRAYAQSSGTARGTSDVQLSPAPASPGVPPGMNRATAAAASTAAGTQSVPNPQTTFSNANTLRDEVNNLTKDYRTVRDAYGKIVEAAKKPTGAGDMSLLYSYIKLLDPGSAVREGEFATAAQSGSLGERMQGYVNRVLSGERLPENLRKDFLTEAQNIYRVQRQGFEGVRNQYTDIAKRNNLKPEDVIVDYGLKSLLPGAAPGAGSPSGAGMPGPEVGKPAPLTIVTKDSVSKMDLPTLTAIDATKLTPQQVDLVSKRLKELGY